MAKLTLRQKQSIFIRNVAKLIIYAFDVLGFELTGGELLRTAEQQALYVQSGKSSTSNSRHLIKLAIDFALFIQGVYKTDKESYRKLGEYWKSLHPDNVWGGDWGWDANHFEMKP